jgi:tetratricopeptide (TPR) repeat protein
VVTEFDPQDVESLKILGQLFYETKRHDEALKCYERVLKINPRDQEAGKMRKNLAAEGAIQTGGFQTAKSARDLAKSQTDLSSAERDQKIVKSTSDLGEMVKELEAQLEKQPGDVRTAVSLSRAHAQQQDYDAAVDVLVGALKAVPDSAELRDALGDTRLARGEARVEEARGSDEPGAADRVKRLEGELLALQVEEYRRRVEAHPTETGLRFRLAKFLLADGETDHAIEQLQQSVKDPRHRIQSLHLLGRAFVRKGILDLAQKQFNEAADAIPGMGDQKKEILYDLALAQERQGEKAKALETYKRIFETDIGFKDVGKKIESLKAG